MSKRQYKKSTEEKLDQILTMTEIINQKVDKQNQELAQLKNEVQALETLVNEMARQKPPCGSDCRWCGRWLSCALF